MTTNPAMPSRNSFWKAMLLTVIAASIVGVLQATSGKSAEAPGYATGNYAWVLRDSKRGEVVIVMVTKGAGNSRAALQGLGRGLNVGAGKTGGRVLEDTMEWSPAAHEYRFAIMAQSMYLRARCLSSMTTGTSSYILCVETVSADPNGLDEARAGVRLASWK